MYKILALFGILFLGCATPRFDINKVDFTHEPQNANIFPLEFHDRSNLSPETADKIMKNVLAKDSNIWGFYYIRHGFDKSEKKIFDWTILNYIGDVLVILGVPKARVFYDLKASAYLFDSNGDIIEIHEKTGSITKIRGLYYGNSTPIKQMESEYKKMFGEIIGEINAHKERTNKLLKLAGTLDEENSAEVYTKIYMIIK